MAKEWFLKNTNKEIHRFRLVVKRMHAIGNTEEPETIQTWYKQTGKARNLKEIRRILLKYGIKKNSPIIKTLKKEQEKRLEKIKTLISGWKKDEYDLIQNWLEKGEKEFRKRKNLKKKILALRNSLLRDLNKGKQTDFHEIRRKVKELTYLLEDHHPDEDPITPFQEFFSRCSADLGHWHDLENAQLFLEKEGKKEKYSAVISLLKKDMTAITRRTKVSLKKKVLEFKPALINQ